MFRGLKKKSMELEWKLKRNVPPVILKMIKSLAQLKMKIEENEMHMVVILVVPSYPRKRQKKKTWYGNTNQHPSYENQNKKRWTGRRPVGVRVSDSAGYVRPVASSWLCDENQILDYPFRLTPHNGSSTCKSVWYTRNLLTNDKE